MIQNHFKMKVKIQLKEPDKRKWYPVRSGNSLTTLKRWINWAEKKSPKQRFIIVDYYKKRMADKKYKEYWKVRYMGGHESKYMVYGTY